MLSCSFVCHSIKIVYQKIAKFGILDNILAYFSFQSEMEMFPGGVQKIWKFRRGGGGGGGYILGPILENPLGHRPNPFHGYFLELHNSCLAQATPPLFFFSK